ncbi:MULTISPECIES: hypothetical protein [unclassified Brucella]|uniref:hypothetical protein n=1 Tax=unclassified Brucella TaxID=2632610 RepID=UPI0012AE81AC|nr:MULTISPECIES: hypothetical protein [unclassified Brucella]MRN79445.1 hypothetical protein [Brucella sp. 10RB9210]UWF59820.1 hypothetical protein NYO66_04730 [Brucella sp. 2716]
MAQAFDTMAYAEDLERRGFKPVIAKALAETARDHIVNRVATKADIEASTIQLKFWIGGALVASVISTAAIASLIISVIK